MTPNGKYIEKIKAINIVAFECGKWRGLAKTIAKEIQNVKSEDVVSYSIDPDGTLTITVPNGTTVNRVLVQEEGTQWGGLFYAD